MEDQERQDTASSPPEAPQSVTLEMQDLVVSIDTFFGLRQQETIKEE
jgi:hypothetical protein